MKRIIFNVLSLSVFMVSGLQAQQLKGVIKDDGGNVLSDVFIYNERTTSHAHSNATGAYQISGVQAGDTIIYSLLGYSDYKHVVRNEFVVDITMEPSPFSLTEVVIRPERSPLEVIQDVDIAAKPIKSSQEILARVPGLFIGQHAGGGKAEQIFLRGFDIDHGTDVRITVDGMPVNMVSHAHGQGYSDLHFLIPEVIEGIGFEKGAYNVTEGNFSTAGSIAFQTKKSLDHSFLQAEIGAFNTQRIVTGLNILNNDTHKLYLAGERLESDGPFDSPQNLKRTNVHGSYHVQLTPQKSMKASLSYFTSDWDASGQIPQRAVDDGTITRFGAIDSTEGGATSRLNAQLQYTHLIDNNTSFVTSLFYSRYDFELFSNFTFFANNPETGDQIWQTERRDLAGIRALLKKQSSLGGARVLWTLGGEARYDQVSDVGLFNTFQKETIITSFADGDVDETQTALFANARIKKDKWQFDIGNRIDVLRFTYDDFLNNTKSSESHAIVLPKVSIQYTPSNNISYYLKMGRGYHSNDARVSISNDLDVLPASYGADLGVSLKPLSSLYVHAAAWYLALDQEFVYVGDEAIVEPSGRTRRSGVDFSIRYEPIRHVFAFADINYAYARSIDSPEGEQFIPLAPEWTWTGGLQYNHPRLGAGIFFRHLGDRNATETGDIIAPGYTIADFNVKYRFHSVQLGLQVNNMFDREWNETQFATTSRLQNEVAPVTEIHFTPGAPRHIMGTFKYLF